MYNLDYVTNDGKYLLGRLYSEYIKRRKTKMPKREAVFFDDPNNIHENYMSEWIIEDVITVCLELKNKGFLSGLPASDSLMNISLTSEAIAVMENSFSDKIETVLEWASKIKSAIPFI